MQISNRGPTESQHIHETTLFKSIDPSVACTSSNFDSIWLHFTICTLHISLKLSFDWREQRYAVCVVENLKTLSFASFKSNNGNGILFFSVRAVKSSLQAVSSYCQNEIHESQISALHFFLPLAAFFCLLCWFSIIIKTSRGTVITGADCTITNSERAVIVEREFLMHFFFGRFLFLLPAPSSDRNSITLFTSAVCSREKWRKNEYHSARKQIRLEISQCHSLLSLLLFFLLVSCNNAAPLI